MPTMTSCMYISTVTSIVQDGTRSVRASIPSRVALTRVSSSRVTVETDRIQRRRRRRNFHLRLIRRYLLSFRFIDMYGSLWSAVVRCSGSVWPGLVLCGPASSAVVRCGPQRSGAFCYIFKA